MTRGVKLKIWLVLAAVFALGCVTGAALGGLYHSRAGSRGGRDGREAEQFEKMRKDLGLSDEQAARVRAILEETRNEYRALRAELRPRFDEPRLKARARIRETLDEGQRQKFDARAAEHDARRGERERRREDGGGR